MNGLPIDHVGVAVASLRDAVPAYERLMGARGSAPEEVRDQGVRYCFVDEVELLEPTAEDTPVGRFLARRGPGLHHVAFRTPDLEAHLDRLRRDGARLVDQVPRLGAGGRLVAFLHPSSFGGVLIELVQADRS